MIKVGKQMTDERIKEEFEKWYNCGSECTVDEKSFYEQYSTDMHEITVGFYAGFRTAELLAKIEVLEDMLRMMDKLRFFSICDYREAKSRIETMLSELKEANR